jgi:hypothetical protein
MNGFVVGFIGIIIMLIAFHKPLLEMLEKLFKMLDERAEKKMEREQRYEKQDVNLNDQPVIAETVIKNEVDGVEFQK